MRKMITTKQVELLNKLAPLATEVTYNKDTNTFEVGGNLYVDGNIRSNDVNILNGTFDIYNNSLLTFYLTDENSERIEISPYIDGPYIEFTSYDDHDNPFVTTLYLTNEGATILTDKNTKSIFGNKSLLKDPEHPENNNIDLYVHYLTIHAGSIVWSGVVYSSNNIVANSPQKLTTLLKANSQQYYIVLHGQDGQCGILYWTNSIWQVDISGQDSLLNVTSVSDIVTTI